MAYTINPYALAQFVTAAISLVLLALVWQRRRIRGGTALLLLFSAILWWAITAGLEAAANSRELKIFWSKLAYVGAYLSPPFFMLFSLFYTNRAFKLTWSRMVGLFILPATIICLAITNESHGLIWSGFQPGPAGTNSLIYEHGFFFWVGIAFIFIIVFLSSFILFTYSVKSQNLYKRQNRLVILASIFPITGTILYVSGLNPFPGLDLIPATFMFTAAALLAGISRQKLLDIIPISHEFLIDQFKDAVIVVDRDMRVIDVNKSAESMLLVERESVIGKQGEKAIKSWKHLAPHFDQQSPLTIEIEQRGSLSKYLQTTISPLKNAQSDLIGWTIVCTDVTRRKTAEIALQKLNDRLEEQLITVQTLQAKLKEQAIRDALTGTFNREYLDSTLQRELARAKRKGSPLSVIMIDIDCFKAINDTYGHKAGDIVIKSVGSMLLKDSRECDYVCRFGGDEFIVVMPEMTEADAVKRAEKWRKLLKGKHVLFRHDAIAPTISIGIAAYPSVDKGTQGLIDAADRAMYAAKDSGRDQVCVFPVKE